MGTQYVAYENGKRNLKEYETLYPDAGLATRNKSPLNVDGYKYSQSMKENCQEQWEENQKLIERAQRLIQQKKQEAER